MALKRKMRGFALSLDVAVVLVCVSILLMVGIYGFHSYVQSARINKAKAECAALALAVEQYAYDMESSYPSYSPSQCLPTYLTNLESKHTSSGKGPWLATNTLTKHGNTYKDPWGHDYVFTKGTGNDGRFVVYSKGPDNNGTVSIAGVATSNGIGASGGFSR